MSPLSVTVTLLTFVLSDVRCAPSFVEHDSVVFPDSDNDTAPSDISDKLKECLKDFSFKIEFNGECHSLLTTDRVCPEGQWLVLDLNSASQPNPLIRGRCAVRRCPAQQHFWVDQRRCVHDNESGYLCPYGTTLDTDYFGDGFCNCIKNPVHIRDRITGACYPAYRQGLPCPQDRIWVKGGCHLDNCTIARARYPFKTIVSWSDGRCYAVNEQGPCKRATEVLRINPYTARPECEDPKAPLHLVDVPCSGTDHQGKCTKAVGTPQNAFYSQVAEQASKKKSRKVSPK